MTSTSSASAAPASSPNGGFEGRQNVTMRDVADRAGVSTMTVSRVMNETALVRPATRERVERAIRELNYRPNLGARRLAGGKSLFIGMVYYNPSPSYLSQVIAGGLEACREGGHHLVLQDLEKLNPYTDPEDAARTLNTADLNALIVTPPLSSLGPFMAALDRSELPLVKIAPGDIDEPGLCVAMDDRAAMSEMVDEIVKLGHARIAFVKGSEHHPSTQHRFEGFQAGLKRNSRRFDPELVLEGDYTFRSGFEAGEALLAMDPRPSVIVASNDDMAAGVIAAAYRQGLSVPQDISVTGFDDTIMATNIWPELTTVRQPIIEMSRRAVELLSAHLHGEEDAVAKVERRLDYEVVMRDSLAAPNGS